MFVIYVRDGDLPIPSVEMGETLDEALVLAKDHVDKAKWENAKKELSSKRWWKDAESGLEIQISGKGK